MKKKNLAGTVLAISLAAIMSLSACGGSSSGGATESSGSAASSDTSSSSTSSNLPAGSGQGLKIGVVVNNSSADTYQTTYYNTMTSYAKEQGVDLTLLDPVGDGTKQANQVQDLIEKGVSVICIWACNSETGVASAQKIKEAGIKCLAVNTPLAEEGDQYIEGYVGPDNYTEGNKSGAVMKDDLGGKGNIVVIEGQLGRDVSTDRYQGMKDAIADSSIKILDSQTGDFNHEKSRTVMENYLTKYGKGEIDAVFCMDDTECLGAIDALEAAGRDDVKVYGAACGDYATLDYIKDGSISGIAIQSPIIDAKTALDDAIKCAKGETIDKKTFMDTPVGTPDNLDSLNIAKW